MYKNGTLVGAFVKKSRILGFLEKLRNELHIPIAKVFVYEISGNQYEYLSTFKVNDKNDIARIPNATVIHVKNGCVFSINALNRLIDREKEKENKMIANTEYMVDWEQYRNKLIILTNDELNIIDLTKIEDKSIFFE